MTGLIVSVLDFFKGLIDFFPEVSVGTSAIDSVRSALLTVLDFISVTSFIVPFDTIFTVIGIVYGFRLFKFTVFCVNWVIRRIGDIIP